MSDCIVDVWKMKERGENGEGALPLQRACLVCASSSECRVAGQGIGKSTETIALFIFHCESVEYLGIVKCQKPSSCPVCTAKVGNQVKKTPCPIRCTRIKAIIDTNAMQPLTA